MKILFLLILSLSVCSHADQPPDWQEFLVQSPNNKWSAVVQPLGNAEKPWEDDWVLNVYEGFFLSSPPPNFKPVWSTPYKPSGYTGGYLSDDGSTFSYVEFWYYRDYPVVKIFREECKILKNGSHFRLGTNLEKTTSHELWLKEGGDVKYITLEGTFYLQLETVKGKRKVEVSCSEKT
ncbi:MAG: hypothetical protein OQJ80_11025 [Kangiella sp.]|nr:hypothetical protein [Kangiella sp.]